MILVTGGCGAMGSVLVKELIGLGRKVRACVLPGDPLAAGVAAAGAEIWEGDITDEASIAGMCEGVTVVYHLAAVIIAKDEGVFERVNVRGTANVVGEALRRGVGHFIYVSSASVLYPRPTPYSLSKIKAEEIVRASGLHFTIIRPTLVYGKTGGQEFDMYLWYLRKFPIVPFIGNGGALKRPVFVGDVTRGLVALCGSGISRGKTYNFSGGEAMGMLDFTRLCLRLLKTPHKPVLRLPVWSCKALAAFLRLFMKDPPLKWQVIAGITQDANLDPGEAMKDLGYAPARVTEKLPECFPRVA